MTTADHQLRIFNDAVAIITGGGSGIGLAIGKALASRGATVILADKQGETAGREAENIRAAGGNTEAAQIDVTDYKSVEQLVTGTLAKYGRIDFMFNNAGIGVCGLISDFELDHWYKVLNVNLLGVIHGIQAVYPVMRKQGFGHIINTSSMGGLVPFTFTGSYTASKYAVAGLSQSLRIEAMDSGVRVSVLCPGVIRTPILKAGGDNLLLYKIPQNKIEESWKKTFPADPDRFAEKAIRQVARNVPIIVVPAWWKLFWLFHRLSPNATLWFIKYFFYNPAMKDLGPFVKQKEP
jgi:NAD(P)-dependent dehydrogenase (short-subunit alcohol dehydrogenase family)